MFKSLLFHTILNYVFPWISSLRGPEVLSQIFSKTKKKSIFFYSFVDEVDSYSLFIFEALAHLVMESHIQKRRFCNK